MVVAVVVVDGTIWSSGPDGAGAVTIGALDTGTAGAAAGSGSGCCPTTYHSTTPRKTTTAAVIPT